MDILGPNQVFSFHCQNLQDQHIKLHALETKQFTDLDSVARYAIERIEVSETVTEEELVIEVLKGMRPYVHNGVAIRELCCVLKKYYGVVAAYCCDLLTRLKIELDMYCPDHKHLYFVDPVQM
jgi:hypothetical protein